ncbi:hypothetical protein FGIG_00162 [Fasciola gigantica]|uniref:Uncharacterized protein n=1 Tax=Fasciola gigantica TaxID=46835 RepID=A0A504YGJ4_FASGI|nr:hypothetical protein FGIG_00162 [Fasciola gigantica]
MVVCHDPSKRSTCFWKNDPNILPEGNHVSDINRLGAGYQMGEKGYEQKNVVDYLTRNGLPSSLGKSDFLGWPQFINQTTYMIFKSAPDVLLVGNSPRERQCLFWRNWYPALLQQVESKRDGCPGG